MRRFLLAGVFFGLLPVSVSVADSENDYYYGQLQNRLEHGGIHSLKGGYYACESEDQYYALVDDQDDEYFDTKDHELKNYPNQAFKRGNPNNRECSPTVAGTKVKVLETTWVRSARVEFANGSRVWTHVDNLIGWHPDNIDPQSDWHEDPAEDSSQSLNR